MANTLSREKQEAALRCLVDGASVRATQRVVGVHRDTVLRLMVRVGQGCQKVMDAEMRGVRTRRIEVDEVWGYVGKKQRHLTPADDPARSGDFWTFVAFDPESKLVPTFRLGKLDLYTATAFLQDLSRRLANRIQLSSDALRAYVATIGYEAGSGRWPTSWGAAWMRRSSSTQENDGEPFGEKMKRLVAQLREQRDEAQRLMKPLPGTGGVRL